MRALGLPLVCLLVAGAPAGAGSFEPLGVCEEGSCFVRQGPDGLVWSHLHEEADYDAAEAACAALGMRLPTSRELSQAVAAGLHDVHLSFAAFGPYDDRIWIGGDMHCAQYSEPTSSSMACMLDAAIYRCVK